MEKLVYVVWKPRQQTEDEFKHALLDSAAPELLERGASGLCISVVDDAVASGARLRMGQIDPPKSGLVTFWVEQAQERAPFEQRIADLSERMAGYLVLESRPLVYEAKRGKPGQRTPGFSSVACIEPRPGLTREEFLDHWFGVHREVALETQSTFAYVRNECIRPLTEDAPPWAAIVEESFPIEALKDPAVFYAATDSPERLERNARRMLDSCRAFLDLEKIDVHPMSEYRF